MQRQSSRPSISLSRLTHQAIGSVEFYDSQGENRQTLNHSSKPSNICRLISLVASSPRKKIRRNRRILSAGLVLTHSTAKSIALFRMNSWNFLFFLCFQIYPDPDSEKVIMGSLVFCIHHKEGCKWSDELRKLKVRSWLIVYQISLKSLEILFKILGFFPDPNHSTKWGLGKILGYSPRS